MAWRDIWFGNRAQDRVLRLCLIPLSWLYAAGWNLYALLYTLKIKRAKRPHFPVVCVGNLRVGGTGKTPFVVALVKMLQEMGHEVAVSASGYGTKASRDAAVAPTGPLDAAEWGDEPALLSRLLQEVPIIVGRNRVRAARLAAWNFPHRVLVLDDGFQHLPLAKDVSIVLEPPCKNMFCLPAGPYREGRGGLGRADLVLPSDTLSLQTKVVSVLLPDGTALDPCTVDVLTAIENPERLVESLTKGGFTVRVRRLLADHDPLTREGLFDGLEGPIVTTEKDWVKLAAHREIRSRRVAVCAIETEICPHEAFVAALKQALEHAFAQRDARRQKRRHRVGTLTGRLFGFARRVAKHWSVLKSEQWGKRLGRLFYRLSAKHRHRARANLQLAFPEFPEPVRNDLVRRCFEHVGIAAAGFLRADNLEDDVLRHIQGSGHEHLDQALALGKGACLITGHFGLWEYMTPHIAALGYPLSVVVRDANNESLNAMVAEIRQRGGVQVLSRGSAARNLVRALSSNRTVGLLADQNSEEAFIPFFGHPTGAALGPFQLALRTGSPIIPMACFRTGPGTYEYTIERPLEPLAGFEPAEGLARAYHLWLESIIRKAPEQYLWIHDRWKSARRRGLVP